jgi:hypothetical protein
MKLWGDLWRLVRPCLVRQSAIAVLTLVPCSLLAQPQPQQSITSTEGSDAALPKRRAATSQPLARPRSGCPADRGIYVRSEDGAQFTVYRYGIRRGDITYEIFAGQLGGRPAYYVMGIGRSGTGWSESYFQLSDPAFRTVSWRKPHKSDWQAEDVVPGITGGPLQGSWKFAGCRSPR